MYFVYALYNHNTGKIYIGQTADLNKRLSEHNRKRGNHFTANVQGEWKLIYKEGFTNRSDAMKKEKYLKSGYGRKFLKKFLLR